jgi:pyridoxamine 5'-phosphate oxidase
MVDPPHAEPLNEADVDPDPLAQFARWFARAQAVVRLPEACALATLRADGAPSLRMVLLKGVDAGGFVFYTNYESDKGHQLLADPRAALTFYWDELGRQVRIEGPATAVSPAESDQYFATRPRGSQLSAHASAQSQPVADRATLERRVEELDAAFAGRPVPRPDSWGGFRLRPERIEFWQNREDRLHDRLLYQPSGDGWRLQRLQP